LTPYVHNTEYNRWRVRCVDWGFEEERAESWSKGDEGQRVGSATMLNTKPAYVTLVGMARTIYIK